MPSLPAKRSFQSTVLVKDSKVENPEAEETIEKGDTINKDAAELFDIPLLPHLKPVTARVDAEGDLYSDVHESELKFKDEIVRAQE